MYATGNYSVSQLESEYGVAKSTISGWIKNLSPIKVAEDKTISMKEYKELQKKMRELEIENEILKKHAIGKINSVMVQKKFAKNLMKMA